MAVKVIAKVWEGYPGDSSVELLVLLALADWSDDEGRSFPSVASIGRKCRVQRRQAQRLVHRLIDAGLVSVIANAHGGAPGSSRRYRINLDRLTGVTADRGVNNAAKGRHLGHETEVRHDTLTVIEPPLTSGSDGRLPCPVEAIIDAYHRMMPDNPRCKILNEARRKAVAARWREAAKLECKPFGYSSVPEGITAWERFFAICAESDFLTGKAIPAQNKPPFIADIDFLMAPMSFAKCLENKYHRGAA